MPQQCERKKPRCHANRTVFSSITLLLSISVLAPSRVTAFLRVKPGLSRQTSIPSPVMNNMFPLENLSELSTETMAAANGFDSLLNMDPDTAQALSGPLFGASLFPYLAFLYFLSREETDCPKGVIVGFAVLLLFVFLTIPAAIVAKIRYDVSLSDCDWLHGSAESLLTITNLVTVVAFRQAFKAKEGEGDHSIPQTRSVNSYAPMIQLTIPLVLLAGVTALVPGFSGAEVHTPYLAGFMDLPPSFLADTLGAKREPANALTIATWIIHISSLVEFLVTMDFAWRWADLVNNPKWKGLTWGLLPLHSSGITACVYHLFYNQIPVMLPLQAFLTCLGNTTAAFATFRIARSEGWTSKAELEGTLSFFNKLFNGENDEVQKGLQQTIKNESDSLVDFHGLGNALKVNNDFSFVGKLFVGCALASYAIKYGETYFDFPYDANTLVGLSFIVIPSALNAYKWER